MSTQPPTPGSPSSPQQDQSPRAHRAQKEFKMPNKDEKKEADFAADLKMQQQMQQIDAQGMLVKEAAAVSATEAKNAVNAVASLIQRMVAKMQVDAAGRVTAQLAASRDVPAFMRSASVQIAQTPQGIAVHITGFETANQQAQAINAIQKNTEALQTLVANLQQKNIQIASLSIGTRDNVVALPRVEAVRPASTIEGLQQQGPDQRRQEGFEEKEEGKGRR